MPLAVIIHTCRGIFRNAGLNAFDIQPLHVERDFGRVAWHWSLQDVIEVDDGVVQDHLLRILVVCLKCDFGDCVVSIQSLGQSSIASG